MTTTVTVKLFATLKERAGTKTLQVSLPEGATVADLIAALGESHPALAEHLPHALVAVGQEYAFHEDPLPPDAEVALFPPVSGGADLPNHFALVEGDPDVNAVIKAITRPDTGGVAVFHGSVRGVTTKPDMPAATDHLVYEAYSPMAEKKMAQIADEIREKFPQIIGVAIVQRIGHAEVGDTTTLVAVSAPHRTDGIFEAARYGIDRLKEIVPVWKKEVGPDGSTWVEGHYQPTAEDVRPEGE